MFNRTFLLALALVVGLWFVVAYFERRRDRRNIDRIRGRLLKKETAVSSADEDA